MQLLCRPRCGAGRAERWATMQSEGNKAHCFWVIGGVLYPTAMLLTVGMGSGSSPYVEFFLGE